MTTRNAWILGIIVVLILLLLVPMLFMGGFGMMGGGGMMGRYGFYSPFGWVGMLLGWIIPLGILVLLIAGVVILVTSLTRRGTIPTNAASGFCPNCGQAVQSDWKNCPHCGTVLPQK